MSRRRSHINYNAAPQPAAAVAAAPAAPATQALQLQNLLSSLLPAGGVSPKPFSLPVGELFGGVSNLARGLVINDNWWIILLFIFLFFPKISDRMFGSILKL